MLAAFTSSEQLVVQRGVAALLQPLPRLLQSEELQVYVERNNTAYDAFLATVSRAQTKSHFHCK